MSDLEQVNGNGNGNGANGSRFISAEEAELRTTASFLLERLQFMRQAGITFDGARDLYDVLGYSRVLTNREYRDRYYRGGIAARVVEALPKATWRGYFDLVEDDDPNTETALESAWKTIDKKFKLRSVFQRVDILAGLSTFAVLLIGAPGETLEQELPKGKPEQLLYFQPYAGGGGLNRRAQQSNAALDAEVTVDEFDTDPKSDRFAQPLYYKLRRADFSTDAFNQRVHWSRIIHVAEGILEDEVFGLPTLERVWNLLDDLDKITGGGAEAFWIRANQGLHINYDKDLKDISPEDRKSLKDNLEDYKNRIDRFIRTRGVEVNTLGSDVANFSNPADAVMTQIAGARGIPKRILTGSEMGELASSQDRDNWKDQVTGRQVTYAGPCIVQPLIDRLIDYSYLPAPAKGPDEYEIKWSPIVVLTEDEKANGALNWAKTSHFDATPVFTTAEIRDKWYGMAPLTEKQTQEELDLLQKFQPPAPPTLAGPTSTPLGGKAGVSNPEDFVADPKTGLPKQDANGNPKLKAAQLGVTYLYSSTQVQAPPDVAAMVAAYQQTIPADDLAEQGHEDDVHVTVKYGLRTQLASVVGMLVEPFAPVEVTLGKTNIFTADSYDVLYIEVSSPDLARLNQAIAGNLSVKDTPDTQHGYVPHMTVAYLSPGSGAAYAGDERFVGVRFEAQDVRFSSADGEVTDLPLMGESRDESASEMLAVLAEAIATGNDDVVSRIVALGRPDTESHSIEDVLTDEDRTRIDEARDGDDTAAAGTGDVLEPNAALAPDAETPDTDDGAGA